MLLVGLFFTVVVIVFVLMIMSVFVCVRFNITTFFIVCVIAINDV